MRGVFPVEFALAFPFQETAQRRTPIGTRAEIDRAIAAVSNSANFSPLIILSSTNSETARECHLCLFLRLSSTRQRL